MTFNSEQFSDEGGLAQSVSKRSCEIAFLWDKCSKSHPGLTCPVGEREEMEGRWPCVWQGSAAPSAVLAAVLGNPAPRTCVFTTALWAEDIRSVQQIHLFESWSNWLSISSYMMSLCNGALCSFLAALEIQGKWVGLGAQWAYQAPRRS